MSNLRRTVDGLLRRTGHDILLQRRENQWAGNSPAYSNQFEKHTVRHMHPSSVGLASIAQEEMEGVVHDFDMVYFFRYESLPHEGDRIYENLEAYPNDIQTFLIDKVIPMRYQDGRIEFWVCGVSSEVPS